MNEDILAINGLSIEILNKLSFRSKLGVSLKNSLHHFNKESLLNELLDFTDWLDANETLFIVALDYRIKSMQSINLKYERYINSNREVKRIFNDVLGFRAFCDRYEDVIQLSNNNKFRVVNMSTGKGLDDGYRGVHLYYQIDNFYYPIEIQYNTYYDRQFNDWLHKYIYKREYENNIGKSLRYEYENGKIKDENEFKEVLNDVLRGC